MWRKVTEVTQVRANLGVILADLCLNVLDIMSEMLTDVAARR